MKFLFICTKNSILDLPASLKKAGHFVSVLDHIYFDPNESVPEQNTALEQVLTSHSHDYDFVISYLFIPAVSDLCFKFSLRYISWTYDSPLNALFTDSVFHPTNYIFVFDREEYLRLKSFSLPHLYHLPLAANTERIRSLELSPKDEAAFSHKITFIGSLYDGNYYDIIAPHLPPDIQEELKQMLSQRLCLWHDTRHWTPLSEACVQSLSAVLRTPDWNAAALLPDELYAYLILIPQKLGQLERITALNTLAEFFPVDFYTNQSSPCLSKVTLHPPVDYYTDACKIFSLSKINLNLTLPSIESGIPQRIFDIMACGGFVLTNYQKELEEYFTIGREIEVFHDLNELTAKCHYYLTHEKERIAIAVNGYKKVCTCYNYPAQTQKMLQMISAETGETP